MHPLSLSIDARLFARFPRLRLGSFVAIHVERASASITPQDVRSLWRAAAAAHAVKAAKRIEPPVTTVALAALAGTVALRHLVRVRGYDLDALPAADITVREANPRADWFLPVGARPTDLTLGDRDVVYAAGTTVLSWAFTACESRQTCLSPETRRAAFVADAVTITQARAAAAALRELRRLLVSRGAVASAIAFVDAKAPHAVLACSDAAVEQ